MQVTIVFPGQGSQYVGMGRELASDYFDRASERLGYDLRALCLKGPQEQLDLTTHTQPAVLTHSIALWEELRLRLAAQNISVARTLGHSVGEYAALVCAGAMDFADAVETTRLRGKFMQQAVPVGQGGMVAILGMDNQLVARACAQLSTSAARVEVANFNAPGQVVIAGHFGAMEKVLATLREQGHKLRAVSLPVSAPFHCQLMEPAAKKLAAHLAQVSLRPLELPYVANVNGREYSRTTTGKILRQNLVQQVSNSVQWTASTQVLEAGAVVIEVGPGQVLKGLMKKCRPDVQSYAVDRDGWEFLDQWAGGDGAS